MCIYIILVCFKITLHIYLIELELELEHKVPMIKLSLLALLELNRASLSSSIYISSRAQARKTNLDRVRAEYQTWSFQVRSSSSVLLLCSNLIDYIPSYKGKE